MLNRINQKIEEIKEKPEYIRKRYAWALTIICTILVGGIWVSTLGSYFNADSSLFKNISTEDTSQAFDDLSEGFADMQEAMDALNDEQSDNPFAEDNATNGNEEARLPVEGEPVRGNQETPEDQVIRDNDSTNIEDVVSGDVNLDDFTEEELREYLQQQEDKFREEMEEDLGGGMLP